MGKTVYLAKANDKLISHCKCNKSLITWPPQLDCPWCGCGWLFTCINCRKAFTFANGIEVDEPLDEIAGRELAKWKNGRDLEKGEVDQWVEGMSVLLKNIEPGVEYVYLDGWFIQSDSESFEITGWHATHKFSHVPHMDALRDKS